MPFLKTAYSLDLEDILHVFGYPLNSYTRQNDAFCNGHVCHGDELPYLFESRWNNLTDTGRRVSQSTASYWANFDKTQNPNIEKSFFYFSIS